MTSRTSGDAVSVMKGVFALLAFASYATIIGLMIYGYVTGGFMGFILWGIVTGFPFGVLGGLFQKLSTRSHKSTEQTNTD